MEITVLYFENLLTSIVIWLFQRVASKLNLQLSNQQLTSVNLEIQYSYLLILLYFNDFSSTLAAKITWHLPVLMCVVTIHMS